MDTSVPNIVFDEDGRCNYCSTFLHQYARIGGGSPREREEALQSIVATIREEGRSKPYDCIVGVSGGADSTYVLYLAKKVGLRPLAVHVDNGWNHELAVTNIYQAVNVLDVDLYTHVLDWDEFKSLQKSFLLSSVVDAELPSDHAYRAVINHQARKRRIRYCLNGRNLVTEGMTPFGWKYSTLDWKFIRSVHAVHGGKRLVKYPRLTLFQIFYDAAIARLKSVNLLNYVDYERNKVVSLLERELSWRDYSGKHFESIYTRFFQSYYLPVKFGYDKRRAHWSSLICAGQMKREDALDRLESTPPADDDTIASDIVYIRKKLNITDSEWNQIMNTPQKFYWEYPNNSTILLPLKNPVSLSVIKLLRRIHVLPETFGNTLLQAASSRKAE